MANFTDFDALAAEPSVSLAFVDEPVDASRADVLILPGSKQTLDDLGWLRQRGFADVLGAHEGILIGICGGFQMLGHAIDDPDGVENAGRPRGMKGLGLLPVSTVLRGEKTVRRVSGRTRFWDAPPFSGYEIHMGETRMDEAVSASAKVWGTYVHGIFDDDAFRHSFLRFARKACGLPPPPGYVCVTAQRESRIDRWANHLKQSLDMRFIHELI
jgi:adenosylcobyric acid synthase